MNGRQRGCAGPRGPSHAAAVRGEGWRCSGFSSEEEGGGGGGTGLKAARIRLEPFSHRASRRGFVYLLFRSKMSCRCPLSTSYRSSPCLGTAWNGADRYPFGNNTVPSEEQEWSNQSSDFLHFEHIVYCHYILSPI